MIKQYNVNRKNTDSFYRYKMPKIEVKVEGKGNGIKTVICNCVDVGRALDRPAEYVCKHFGFELGAQVNMNAETEKYIVNGSHEAELLQDKLDSFIWNWVLCNECKNPETTLKVGHEKKNPDITQSCKACGHSGILKIAGRMTKYIQMNPPKKFKKGTVSKESKPKKPKSIDNDVAKNETKVDTDTHWDLKIDTDIFSRVDRILETLTSKLSEMTDGSKLIDQLEMDQKIDLFVKHVKRHKKQMDEEDFLSDYGAEAVLDLSKVLKLGSYGVWAYKGFAKFSSKIIEQIEKFSEHLQVLCKDDKDAQLLMIGIVEETVKAHKTKLLPKTAHILKLLYDEDIVEDEIILKWASKPTKKFTTKKHATAMIEADNMEAFLKWLAEPAESSDESDDESEEGSDKEVEEPKVVEEEKKIIDETPVIVEKIEKMEIKTEEKQNIVLEESDDDESDLDIDDI